MYTSIKKITGTLPVYIFLFVSEDKFKTQMFLLKTCNFFFARRNAYYLFEEVLRKYLQ